MKKQKNKKILYKDIPEWDEAQLRRVKDFLPPPEELVFRQDTKKVTIALSQKSIAYFKKQAKKLDVSYQAMIRELLDTYVQNHQLRDSDD